MLRYNNLLITLKQTNKLIGIVKKTRTHERKISIFPHVVDSELSWEFSALRKREEKSDHGEVTWKNFNFAEHRIQNSVSTIIFNLFWIVIYYNIRISFYSTQTNFTKLI